MSDDIKIGLTLNDFDAQRKLVEVGKQLLANDNAIAKLRRSGVLWAEEYTDAQQKVKAELVKLGKVSDAVSNQQLKNSKAFTNALAGQITMVNKVSDSLDKLTSKFTIQSAAKLPVTAALRGDDEKRRLEYFAKLQQAHVRTQSSLEQFRAKQKATAEAVAKANLKQKTSTDIASTAQKRLADSASRVSPAMLAQAGAVNTASSSWRLFKQEIRETVSVANLFQTAARGITGILLGMGSSLVNLAKSAPDLASDMLGYRNALQLVTGSQEEATTQLNTAIQMALRLRLSIVAVTKEYSKFTNAATIAGLSVQKSTETFQNFAIAARVLNLTQQRTSGMFLALEQMVSKGRVSMEELRRQLGEHIPGALNLAAEAMGYARGELGQFIKDVSQGKIVSIELVEALGKLVKKRTIEQLGSSLHKFSSASQNAKNALTLLQLKFGAFLQTVLVPFLEGFAEVVIAFSAMLPATQILGEQLDDLAVASINVQANVEAMRNGMASITTTFDTTATAIKSVSTEVKQLALQNDNLSFGSMALVGVMGATGLSGAFAVLSSILGKARKLLVYLLGPLFSVIASFTKFKSIINILKGIPVYLATIRTGFLLLALANPFTAIATVVIAATTALAYWLHTEAQAVTATEALDAELAKISTTTKEATSGVEDLHVALVQLQDATLAKQLNTLNNALNDTANNAAITYKEMNTLKDSVGIFDSLALKVGYTTDAMYAFEQAERKATQAAAIATEQLAGLGPQLEQVKIQAESAVTSYKEFLKIYQTQIDQKDLLSVQLELKLVGKDDLTQKIARIQEEFEQLRSKAIVEAGTNTFKRDELIRTLEVLYDLKIELVKTQDVWDKTKDAIKQFDSSHKSLNKSITSSITTVEREIATMGLRNKELADTNTKLNVTALTEKLYKLEVTATTEAQKAQIDKLRLLIAQYNQLSLVKNAALEDARNEAEMLKLLKQEYKDQEKLREAGAELLKDIMPLEQQYAMLIDELRPKLEAAGASHAQMMEIFQEQWDNLSGKANKAYKTIAELTKEIAKDMQNNFSDFFFDIMQGKFTDLADNFKATLDRMVADAMAANLAKYLLTSSSTGGFFEKLVGTFAGAVLGGSSSTAPATTSFTNTASGMVTNIPAFATGGSFMVGGSGGVDSQIVSFKASPTEKVTVETKAQQKRRGSGDMTLNFNVSTPDADSFRASQGQIEEMLAMATMNARRQL